MNSRRTQATVETQIMQVQIARKAAFDAGDWDRCESLQLMVDELREELAAIMQAKQTAGQKLMGD